MKLHDWQSRFEAWLADNHSGQDAAHDIFHFRRVWMTAQKLGTDAPVDWLVVLT
ncbi:hydrolase, partial [Escherichia coli]